MRSVTLFTVLGALAAAITLSACQDVPESHEFLVRRTPPAVGHQPPELPTDAPFLHLRSVQVASHVKGLTVVRPDGEIDTLVYHRWAAPISEMVSEWLASRILEAGCFRDVLRPTWSAAAGVAPKLMSVDVDVLQFELVEQRSGETEAHVSIRGRFVSNGQLHPLQRATASAPVEDATGAAYAAAFGQALEQAGDALVASLLKTAFPDR